MAWLLACLDQKGCALLPGFITGQQAGALQLVIAGGKEPFSKVFDTIKKLKDILLFPGIMTGLVERDGLPDITIHIVIDIVLQHALEAIVARVDERFVVAHAVLLSLRLL